MKSQLLKLRLVFALLAAPALALSGCTTDDGDTIDAAANGNGNGDVDADTGDVDADTGGEDAGGDQDGGSDTDGG